MQIADRVIGDDQPPLVIVEIGINHNGDLAMAKTLVDAAWQSGAEVIKHQTHVIDDEMSGAAKKVIPGNASISIYDIMQQCALDADQEWELKCYVESKGMIFISTPFSRAAADRLAEFDVPAFKIGSGECNNYPLIDHIARMGKPMIVSTGMNTLESVGKSVDIMRNHQVPFALMHTTNLYPTPVHLVRLGAMQALMEAYPDINVGLSDHTTSNLACFSAVALGANLLERHFTDRKDRSGPDIVNSMDPVALRELILGAEDIRQMRGGVKAPAQEEQVTIDFAFATVVTIKPIKRGERFSKDNLWVKRPGTGEILAEDYQSLLGKTALTDIPDDTHLSRNMIDG